jgi:hypothetical protein
MVLGMFARLNNKLKTFLKSVKKYFFFRFSGNEVETFRKIYRTNYWGDNESVSGPGSNKVSTNELVSFLVDFVEKEKIKKIHDCPCGDFNWMSEILTQIDSEYLGSDIVEDIVLKNTERYSSERITFKVKNIITDELGSSDLLITRDCLIHLSNDNVRKVVDNIKRSNVKYWATTRHIEYPKLINADISNGDFRALDIEEAPFDFNCQKVAEFNELDQGSHKRVLSVYRM